MLICYVAHVRPRPARAQSLNPDHLCLQAAGAGAGGRAAGPAVSGRVQNSTANYSGKAFGGAAASGAGMGAAAKKGEGAGGAVNSGGKPTVAMAAASGDQPDRST